MGEADQLNNASVSSWFGAPERKASCSGPKAEIRVRGCVIFDDDGDAV